MEKNKQEKTSNVGLITFIICAILVIAIIVGCLFFPKEIFGLFQK